MLKVYLLGRSLGVSFRGVRRGCIYEKAPGGVPWEFYCRCWGCYTIFIAVTVSPERARKMSPQS